MNVVEMGSNHSKEIEPDAHKEREYHTSDSEEASHSNQSDEFVEEYEEEKIQEEDQQIEAKLTDHLGKTCKVMIVNWTTFTWDLTSCHAHHGHFIDMPAKTLKPRERTICATSSATFFTGTSATLLYRPNVPTAAEPIHFELYWTVPFTGKPRFTYKAPTEFSVEIALRKDYTEANASISFYITEMSLIEGKSIPFSVLERLTQVTYFDRRELKLLYRAFMRAVAPERSISPDLFRRIFPEFDNPLLLRSVFNAFDVRERADDEISFSEFVEVLSIMVRGSMAERAHLAFRICDLNKDGEVEREEVLQVYQQVMRAMHKSGISTESYSDPRNLVRSIFRKRRGNSITTTPKGGPKHHHHFDHKHHHHHQQEGLPTVGPVTTDIDEGTKPSRRQRLKERLKHPLRRRDKSEDATDFYGDEDTEDLRDEEDLLDEYGTETDDDEEEEDQDDYDEEDLPPLVSSVVREGQDSTLYHEALTRDDFIARAKRDPDYLECFGLFDYFYNRIVAPIEREAEKVTNPEMKGWLLKERRESMIKLVKRHPKRDRYWFELRSGFVAYYDNNRSNIPKNVVNLTSATIKEGTGLDFKVTAGNWSRTLYARDMETKTIWVNAFRANIKGLHRHKSFAPERNNITCEWYVNGKEYFDALLPALLKAKRRVYIADWSFAPYLFLKRSVPLNLNERLDNVLIELAKKGVKVFVIVWNAPKFAYDLRPKASAQYLNEAHKNIYVLTHPNRISMWSHHQKFVVIDEEIAFLGGIDLCYGRYEDSRYLVTDPNQTVYPGRDYQNINHVTEANGPSLVDVVDRSKMPRMPWHDVQIKVEGLCAYDVGVNFIQRWNHALKTGSEVSVKKAPFLMPLSLGRTVNVNDLIGPSALRSDEIFTPHPETKNINILVPQNTNAKEDKSTDEVIPPPVATIPVDQIDLNASVENAEVRKIRESIKADMKGERENIVTKVEDPHVEHEFTSADVADEIAARIQTGLNKKAAVETKERLHLNNSLTMSDDGDGPSTSAVSPMPPPSKELAKSNNNNKVLAPTKDVHNVALVSEKVRDWTVNIAIGRIDKNRSPTIDSITAEKSTTRNLHVVKSRSDEVLVPEKSGPMRVQIVRSVAHWSAGVTHPESSIHHAMLSAITNAKKFIYIGNQYFISSINRPSPKNRLLKALHRRISEAIRKNENFKVVVVLPVYPAGDLNSPTTTYIIQYVYMSIVRFKSSLLDRLQREFPLVDLEQYITFHALRSWGVLNGKPVTEQVYVHAKIMIIDDRTLIVGSANINDRSLRGTRDSEICGVVEEEEAYWIDSKMGGEEWKVSPFVHSLRCRLWCDYLGFNDVSKVQDPIDEQFYHQTWLETARMNSKLFLDVFKVLPDNVLTLADIKKLDEGIEYDPDFLVKLNQIRGILVQFPKDFLRDSDLEPGLLTKERILPKIVFM